MKRAAVLLLSLTLFSWHPMAARAESEGESIYRKLLRSTAWIVVPQGRERGPGGRRGISFSSGTGSLIDSRNKLVLTNYHVVGDRDEALVLFPRMQNGKLVAGRDAYMDMLNAGQAIRARVKARAPEKDLALLELDQLPKAASVVPLARGSAGPGQRVHSIGNPAASGALFVYTSGTVRTAAYRKAFRFQSGRRPPMEVDLHIIETQSPTNPGDSGGPLVNDAGELVAVTQGGVADAQQVSIFIDVREVVELLKGARVRPQYASRRDRDSETAENPEEGESKKKRSLSPEKLATARLKYARTFLRLKEPDKARKYCEEILAEYPETKAAVEARAMLEELVKKQD